MYKLLTIVFFFIIAQSFAQYNEGAPWMQELKKKQTLTSKTSEQVYTFDEITTAFDHYWIGRDRRVKGSGYKPFMRWRNYWKHFVKPDGYLPTSRDLLEGWRLKNLNNKAPNPTSNWTSIGPFDVGTLSIGLPGNGRINSIAVDPNNESIWYTGAPAGGLWKSTDSGTSWINIFDDFPQIGISGIAIDPNNSDIIYVSTGDDDAQDSYGIGVYKSIDGGASWQDSGLSLPFGDASLIMNEIFIDPSNSSILWVGTSNGLYKSEDAGASWSIKQAGNVQDFRLKPGDGNTVYAVTASNYYKTTNGEDFNQITDIIPATSGRLVIGVSPADPDVVYILSADTGGNGYAYQGLFKSTDSGETFSETSNSEDIFERNQAWFDLAIAVSPQDEDEVYIGAINVWKSTNGGNSFIRLNNNDFNFGPAFTHVDIHTLKFYNNSLFCGSDGGLFVSSDGGTTFDDKSSGLAITQFYRISVANGDANKMAGGTQDNSGYIYNNQNWDIYTGGDGMDYEIDPTNSNLVYGFPQFGSALYITTDAGQSLGFVGAPSLTSGGNEEGNWITPLAISSTGDVYAGYRALYKLNGNSWEKISGNFNNGNIEDIEIYQNDPLVIYVADNEDLMRSDDGGATFDLFHEFDSDISDIAINFEDGNVVYVTTSSRAGIPLDFQQPLRGVFRLTSNGTDVNVEDITFNLPTYQAFFAISHQGRHTDNPIFVGTSHGVYRLDDTLTEWEEYFTNLPSVGVSDLEISLDDELLTASTYGRGVWQSPIPIQLPDDDIRLVSFSPDFNVVSCGEVIPDLLIENKGQNPITSVDVVYSVNGGADQNFNESLTLNSGETTNIQLPALTMTSLGETSLEISVSIANDAFLDNNNITNTFIVNSFGQGGTVNTFETPDEILVAYNENDTGSVWEKGIPSGTLLNQAASGTQAYGTVLDGNHPDATKGFLLSGCYEMSSILAPVLKFNMAYDLEINFDIVYVQYSTDGGLSWSVLGTPESQPNWYNSDRTNANSGIDDDCQNCPGAQWTGTDAEMKEYAYDFTANAALGETDLTNEANVLFRIVFHSDPAVTQEGAVIDDFVLEGFQDDEDDDNDGILDVDDNCPLVGNSAQLDTDMDGMGDACDTDDDNDGIPDLEDNCPLMANADQADADNDNIGDVCDDDLDNDGVPNADDQCPNSPQGAFVDVTGCEVFSLPANNFSVLTTAESCISSNNGSVSITAQETLNYTAELVGDGVSVSMAFTENALFEGLMSGTYTICVTVEGEAAYESCFELTITEPEPLSVSSKISSLNNELTLDLAGGINYTITLNGKEYTTTGNTITLPLSRVENVLQVKTDKDCQGVHEETIILSDELFIYPNPVPDGILSVYLGNSGLKQVDVAIFAMNGRKVFAKPLQVQDNEVKLNVDNLAKGIYILNVRTNTSLLNYKIVRK